MPLRQVYTVTCDAPSCSAEIVIRLAGSFTVARFRARELGWESSYPHTEWFCPADANLGRLGGGAYRRHEDWCPWETRRAACGCGGVSPVPPTGMDTYGQGLRRYRPGREFRRVEIVPLPPMDDGEPA